jgi:hypothetical protein
MPESSGSADGSGLTKDPAYLAAVMELLGAVAYGEISAFERMADDSRLAPTLEDKVALATMASSEFGKVARLHQRVRDLGGDPFEAMAPFRSPIDDFHAHTTPADWFEGLVKAYVGDGLVDDFYREIARVLDPETRDLILGSMEEGPHAAFVVARARAGIEADPRLGGRLALWSRRLMAEALTQAQRVAAEREALTAFLVGGAAGVPAWDLVEMGRLFGRLNDRHAERMQRLGLQP